MKCLMKEKINNMIRPFGERRLTLLSGVFAAVAIRFVNDPDTDFRELYAPFCHFLYSLRRELHCVRK